MGRKIKRLQDRRSHFYPSVDKLIRTNPEAWDKELRQWHHIGINTGLLRFALEGSGVERGLFEEQLEARVDSLTTWKIRRARSALKHAEPLIRLLKTEWALDGPPDLFFGDLGEQIERSVQTYIETRRPTLPAHRPDEPWLTKGVLRLARPLRACGQSWRETIRALHRIFTLAGHDDIVTAEKIRHIIRRERGRDSRFGSDGQASPAVSAWFKKSAPVSPAVWASWTETPQNASRRGRPRRRKGRRAVNR